VRTLKHGVTVHDITLDCFAGQIQSMASTSPARWFAWEETEALALPSTMRQLLRWLRRHPCGDGQLSLL
jgi:hypothetical protein